MNTFDLACAVLASATYIEGVKLENQVTPFKDAVLLPGNLGYKSVVGSGFEASARRAHRDAPHGI